MKERKGEVIRDASGERRAFADIIGLAFFNRHLNPYVTLAYERLIRGRGHEIGPDIAASPDPQRRQ